MTERYVCGVPVDQQTRDRLKEVQLEMEKRNRRRFPLRIKKRGAK